MTTTLALLRDRDRIITEQGTPTLKFQNDWQKLAEMVEDVADTFDGLVNAANDAAASAAGVSVGGLYRNGSVVMIRVV